MPRRKRTTLSPAHEVGGCLWRVSSSHSDGHVIAPDAETAMAVYRAIPSVMDASSKDADGTEVLEVKRLALCVFGMPIDVTDETQD